MSTCRNKERVKKNELTDWDLGLVNASEPGELVMARVAMNHDGDWQEREKITFGNF